MPNEIVLLIYDIYLTWNIHSLLSFSCQKFNNSLIAVRFFSIEVNVRRESCRKIQDEVSSGRPNGNQNNYSTRAIGNSSLVQFSILIMLLFNYCYIGPWSTVRDHYSIFFFFFKYQLSNYNFKLAPIQFIFKIFMLNILELL